MRLNLQRIILLIGIYLLVPVFSSAQNCFRTGLNGRVINLPCNQTCINVPLQIPHLKSSDEYNVVSIAYNPFTYVTAAPGLFYAGCTSQLQDDKFFDTVFLPFKFCFYGQQYQKLAVSTNGVVTFDSLNAMRGSNWSLNNLSQLPFAGTAGQGTGVCPTPDGNPLLPRAAIFGAYYDLDISGTAFPNRKMEVRVEGTAPCRKFIASYFEIPLFSCTSAQGTQQIVLHESTGLIDVYIGNKPACGGWNEGRAILGIQNWDRDKAVTAPGKNNTQWSESNTAYQFVPSGGVSRFKRIEVLNFAGTVLATGDTITTTAGLLDVTFPALCNTGATTQYVIRTVFGGCIAGEELISLDTITVNRTNSLEATSSNITQTDCGINGTGTVTINVPPGIGTAPYTFTINPGGTSTTATPNTTFTNLSSGNYTVNVVDASTNCVSIVPVTIASTGVLLITLDQLPTSCAGATNGVINITASNAQPPLQYSLNGGAWTPGSSITNLPAGTHFVSVRDAGGCEAIFVPITVDDGVSNVSGSAAPAPTSCAGVNNGSFTVTPSGTGPFEYSINGGTNWQTSPTFTGLAPGTYNVIIRAGGQCLSNPIPVIITAGSGLTGTLTPTSTTCAGVNNGSILATATSGTGPFTFRLDGTVILTGNPSVTFTGVSAGSHTVTITDANGCTTVTALTTTVTAGTGYTAGAAPVPTSCFGVNNGSVTITPAVPGVSPYTFVLTPGNVTQTGATNTTYNGLAPGTYSVRVTDAVGCQATVNNIVIAQGNGLTGTLTPTSTTCTGVNNGSVLATATSGTGPYTFRLDGTVTLTGNPSVTFTGVATGSHSVTITDANGCTTVAALTTNVTAGTGYTANAAPVPTGCFGVNNGSVTITPTVPGVSPYTFVLTPGSVSQTGAVNTTYNGLAPGTYSVLVTDAVGCQATASNIVIAQGNGLTGNVNTTSTACVGVNTGTVIVTATSGTAPYTFVMDGTVTLTGNSPMTFTGVAAGSHSVTIRDANGCLTATALTGNVAAGTGFTATSTPVQVSCLGATNGSITINPQAPGTGPYTFVLSPGSVSQTGATTTTYSGLGAGTYNVLVTDANGCQTTVSNITLAPGAGLTASLVPSPATCTGATNGSIRVTATNGTGPYTFVLDASITQTGNPTTTFTGLSSGTHNVTITDANGCRTSASLSTTVTAGTGFTANFTPAATACVGVNNGGITIEPQAPGTGPYTFVLTPGNITQTDPTRTTYTGLAPGTYGATVTDANGCQTTLSNMVVTQGSGIQANLTPTNVACFGTTTGSILVTPSNGTGPFTFTLTGAASATQTGAGNTTFANLGAGNYSITITDAAGCVTSAALTQALTQPTALTAPAPAALPVTCNGGTNGQITISPVGGTAPYTYALNAGPFQATNSFNVAQGSYTIRVRDSRGCEISFPNIVVTQPAPLAASILATSNASCAGGADGTIQVAASGGTTPYQYTTTATYQASSTLNVIPGSYTVTVIDANNCRATVPGVVVGLTDNLTLSIDPSQPVCEGKSIKLNVNSNAASYTWDAAAGLTTLTAEDPSVSPTVPTTYTVHATLGNCSRAASVDVDVLPAPVADAGVPGDICFGHDYQLSGSGGVSYAWTPTLYLDDPTSPTPTVQQPKPGITTYHLSVTGANGCTSLNADNVIVKVTPPLSIKVTPIDTIVHAGAVFDLLAVSGGTYYEWTPATGLNDPTIPNPTVTASMTVGDVIKYQVVASSSAGCESLPAVVTIRVYKGPEIYVPTAFTPNNDGKNEVFYPVPVGIKKLNYFRVFNRWGQLVFATTAFNHGWDGKMGGKEQANDVYVWMVQGTTETGQIITKQGIVTLVR